jgi:hypothetical protein
MNKKLNCRKIASTSVVLSIILIVFSFSAFIFASDSFAESAADSSADFSGTALIENRGDKQYKAVRLSPEIYRHAQPKLVDLRIFDHTQLALPYFIHSFSPQTTVINKSYEMYLLHSFVKEDYFYFDYFVNIPVNEDILATSIIVTTKNSGFAKQVELWGSYDNQHWEKVKNDLLYRVEGNEKLEIFLGNEGQKYTHYRFKIANNLEKLSFDSVYLKYNNIILDKENFTDVLKPQYTVEEQQEEQKTFVKITGIKNLKLESIELETESIFKRVVSFADNRFQKMLYNLNFRNTNYRDMIIPLDGFVVGTDTVVLAIENKDDQPVKIKGLTIKYYVDEVIFKGVQDGEYQLKFGNREIIKAPSYDLVNYKEQILEEGYDVLSIQELQIKQEQERELGNSFNPQGLFNVVIVLVAVVLGVIILIKLKNSTSEL